MKKINSMLLLITLSVIFSTHIQSSTWQDVLDTLTTVPNQSTNIPKNTHRKSESDTPINLEHAQKLAQGTSIKAMEAANLSMSAIKNVALHLNNIQNMSRVTDYLHNVVSGRGNSIEETEKAKKLLHEILSEAKKLEKNAHEATLHLEKTLRSTTKLNQRLHTIGTLPNATLSRILDSLKTSTINKYS